MAAIPDNTGPFRTTTGVAGILAERTPWVFFALLGVTLLIYHQTAAEVVERWSPQGGYSHGWLILGIVIWALWQQRKDAFLPMPGRRWPWSVVVLGASLVWLLASLVTVQMVQQLALLSIIVVLPFIVLGFRGGLRVAGALSLLIFVIPIWDGASPILQDFTTRAMDVCLDASRIPAFIVGNQVTIPSGQFRIASGCSGLHFFVSGLALASMYSYLYLRQWSHRILLVGVTVVVAILANWGRVYGVILAGHLTDMQHFLVTVDHYYFGWLLFGISMIPVFFLAIRLERAEEHLEESPGRNLKQTRFIRGSAWAPLFALMAISIGPAAYPALLKNAESRIWSAVDFPPVSGWIRSTANKSDWRPDFQDAESEMGWIYRRGEDTVVVWLMYYPTQTTGPELIFYANRLFDKDRWRRLRPSVSRSAGLKPPVHSVELIGTNEVVRRLTFWYEVGGRVTTDRWAAKALQIPAMLEGRSDGALVAVSAMCGFDCVQADELIADFLSTVERPLSVGPLSESVASKP